MICKFNVGFIEVRKLFLTVCFVTCSIISVQAQILHAYYKVGMTTLDPTYMDNQRTLETMSFLLSSKNILSVDISGYSSPEGVYSTNIQLSEYRVQTMKDYIVSHYPHITPDKVNVIDRGIYWEGLRDLVSRSDFRYKDDVLSIIDEVPEKIINNTSRQKQLMDLAGGDAWRYMSTEYFPFLRLATLVVHETEKAVEIQENPIIEEKTEEIAPAQDTVVVIPATEIVTIEERAVPVQNRRPFLMAIKTNLLYDAAITPNLAVEFYLGRNWSFEGEFNYAWWSFSDTHFHRIELGGAELRKWFGRKSDTPLNGWFTGVYGLAGNYDLSYGSFKQKSSRSGTKKQENSGLHDLTYTVGLSAGYSMPIAKRLNLEFELGIGYLWGKYDKYSYDSEYRDYHYMETKNRHYFGPTKLEVSLSWLIGNGYNVKTKGGAQ